MSSKSSHLSSFANEPYARKFHRYRFLGKGKLRPWKFYTLVTALIRLVILQIHIFKLKGRYTYDVHENCPNHLSSYIQNSSTPLTLNVQFQTNPPSPLEMVTNQLKWNIILGWLVYFIRSFLQVDFRFQYQLINLAWLSIDFI